MKHLSTLLMVWGLCISFAYGQYCIPSYNTGPTVGDSIVSFQLGTINGTLPGSPTGYNDYTAVSSTILIPGLSYTATIINNPTYSSGVTIWIDYNQNQTFEATELAAQTPATIPAGGTTTLTFTVPVTALPGVTRLRMMQIFATIPSDPCQTGIAFGETEDYGITIPAGQADDVTPVAVALTDIDCGTFGTGLPLTVNLANIGSNVADTVLVSYSLNAGPTVTDTAFNLPATTLTPFTFPGLINISPSSVYTIVIWTDYAPDLDNSNDTLTTTFLTPPVFTFPYTEDFEAFTTGNPGTLANGWSRTPASGFAWLPNSGTTGSFATGPADDHTAAGSVYMYTEASSGGIGATASLISPCISLAGAMAPRLNFWYHMFGAQMGTMEVHIITGGIDSLVWSLSGPQQTSETDDWLEASVDLSGFAGQVITLEFRGIRANGLAGDMAIDDISLVDPAPIDAAAFSIEPTGQSCYGTTETVTVLVRNDGNQTLDFSANNAVVSLDITGASAQNFSTTVTSGTVGVLNTFPVDVTVNADLSAQGFHNFVATVSMVGDTLAFNDTTLGFAESLPVFSTPYLEDFETFTTGAPGTLMNGWTRSNINAGTYRWQVDNFGTGSGNTGPADDHTLNGSIYMYTEASTGFNDSTSLFTPCIDLGGLTAPRLAFWYHMYGAAMGTLKVSVNTVGSSTLVWSLSGQQQTSDVDPWLEAIVDLTPFAGQTIQLEFEGLNGTTFTSDMAIDDVEIYDPAPIDAATLDISPTGASCYSAAETVTVLLRNEGNQTLDFSANNAVVTLDITGASTQNFTATVTSGTVAVLDSFPVVVTTSADLSAQGFHNFEASVALVGDTIVSNDSTLGFAESLPVVTAPYIEDFETFIVGVPGVLANGWTRSVTAGTNQGWLVDNFGTPTGNTGPADDHTATGSNYMFIESSTFSTTNTDFSLFSPCIDLTGLTAPQLKFWYHMFGANMGTLEARVRAPGIDSLIWSASGQQQSSSAAPWLEAIASLNGFVGQTVQIEFRGFYAQNLTSDMAIDDVQIFDPPPLDAALTEIVSPMSGCGLGSNMDVVIEVTNYGSSTLSSVDVSVSVNNGPATTVTATGSFPPFGTTLVTFPGNDFSTPGDYDILTWTTLVGDTLPLNDSAFTTITSIPVISTYPYLEDFEAGNGGWLADQGSNGTWALGLPAKNTIQGAASGVNAWVTGGLGFGSYNNNDNSQVVGPCFDFSAVANPGIAMDVWWNSEFSWDGAVLQSSIDVGATWQNVGTVGDPNNWYTDGTINGTPGGQQEGWTGRVSTGNGSGGWVEARHALDSLGGQSAVLLRVAFGSDGSVQDDGFAFDNVLVYEIPTEDLGVAAYIEPATGGYCDGDSVPISVLIENFGVAGQAGYPVTVDITGPVSNSFTVTSPDSIQPGDTDTVFVGSILSAVPGDYTLTAYTLLNGDTTLFNDTTISVVTVSPVIATYPYIQDFESGNGGWTANQGDAGTWAFGTPAKNVIQGAASGVNAWVTGGLGTTFYNNNDNSFVLGPCFDFSALLTPAISLSIWWDAQNSVDGAVLQSSIDGGGTWQNVGAFGDPVNWFNDNTISGQPGGQQIGWTGTGGTGSNGWVEARHALDNLGGEPSVQLRVAFGSSAFTVDDGFAFDDVTIYDIPTEDLGVAAILDPSSGYCTGDSIPVSLVIENFGIATQANIPITVNVSGPSPLVFNVTSPDSLAPGDIDTVVVGSFPAVVPGDYTFQAYTVLSGDTLFFNDSTNIVDLITIIQTASAPVVVSDSICAQDSAEFQLLALSPADNHFWYDSIGGDVIFTGDTFNTGFLSASATYYVQASNGLLATQFTPPDNSIGGGGNANFTAGLVFDVLTDMTLNTVRVYPNGPGNIVTNLYDGTGALLETTTIPYGGSVVDTVITLNWDIAPGVGYSMDQVGTTTGGLFRNTTGANYPYTSPGVVTITNAINNLPDFYYFYYDWQVTAAGCPSPIVPVTAAFLAPVAVDLGADGTVCQGYELDATGPGITSYVWNGDPLINTPTITPDTTGVYYVDVANADGCTGTDSVILIINPSPVVNLGPDPTECDSVILDAGNIGATYVWTLPDGSTSTDQIIIAEESGTYVATVTALGCPNSDSIDVVINESPDVNFGPDLGVCEPITLDAGPIGTPVWSTGETTQQITIPAPMAGGSETISVTVTTAEGCSTFEDIVISEGMPPVFDLGTEIEDCDSTVIDAPVIGGAIYDWSTGESTPSIVATTAGVITLTITDSVGCEATDSVDVNVQPTPVADATFSNPNFDNTIQFVNNSTPSTGASYEWDFGDGLGTSTDASPVYTYPYDGTWEVTLIVSNDCGADTTKFTLFSVSIDKLFDQSLSVYPSPTKGEVFITSDDLKAENLSIEVLDSRGRSIIKDNKGQIFGSFKHVVDLQHEAEGIYMIKITDGERTAYKRVMKE